MTWKIKSFFLLVLLIPSFIKYPFNILDGHIVFGWTEQLSLNGPTDGQLLYFVTAIIAIWLICGGRIMLLGLTTGALISVSIVFAGGFIAFIKTKIGVVGAPSEFQYSPYYIARLVNIETVVPVSLALFFTIPFLKFERSILSSSEGVSIRQKSILIVVRVINNVRYCVLPDIWSVLKEENTNKASNNEVNIYFEEAVDGQDKSIRKKIKKTISKNLYIAASAIASAIEYVPLWAVEISKLPTKQKRW